MVASFGARTPFSSWSRRAPVVALALVGGAIAVYLALCQMGVMGSVWDPVFGSGSEAVLTSPLSRALPVPDALLGAAAYGLDAALGLAGGDERWRTAPWLVVLHGVVLLGLVAAAIGLILTQALVLRTGCLLCFGSAAVSFASGWLAHDEVSAALHRLRTREDPE